jgi:endonuclease III
MSRRSTKLEQIISQLEKRYGPQPPPPADPFELILWEQVASPALALESNGLRALVRPGYAEEQKNYSATYRAVRDAVQGELKRDFDWLIAAHQLLRWHGQEIRQRSTPLCEQCPIRESCDYFTRCSSFPPQCH